MMNVQGPWIRQVTFDRFLVQSTYICLWLAVCLHIYEGVLSSHFPDFTSIVLHTQQELLWVLVVKGPFLTLYKSDFFDVGSLCNLILIRYLFRFRIILNFYEWNRGRLQIDLYSTSAPSFLMINVLHCRTFLFATA